MQSPRRDGGGDVFRFLLVQRRRRARGLHRAETTGARARVPHDHDGGGGGLTLAPSPALAQVRTPRLLAHRAQLELAKLFLDLHVLVPARHDALHPRGLAHALVLERRGRGQRVRRPGKRVALDEVVEPGAGREARAEGIQAVALGPLGRHGRRGGFRGEPRADGGDRCRARDAERGVAGGRGRRAPRRPLERAREHGGGTRARAFAASTCSPRGRGCPRARG
mmetsp:Transcript_5367/g.21704  ORF Transcript_5367/g.21704 Transcript_5367/m.21704 type:complete len:223 (-) Transcript_5367:221-889(-)